MTCNFRREKSSPSTNSFRAWSDEKNREVCLISREDEK